MFKLRSGGQGGSGPAQTPSIESIRRQARHRLIGASVLVLAGIIGLPLLLDSQPRPVPVDIRIDIPDKHTAPPLADAQRPAAVTVAPVTPVTPAMPPSVIPPAAAPALAATPAPPAPPAPTAAPPPAAASPAAASPAAPPPAAASPAAASPATPRLVVQVGAFAQEARAQEVRQRLERAGLRTYTQIATTPDGPRIRVRLGPFNTRAEAERAAERVRQLGLPASILTL